jgi:putative ABC transport system ATP-binding protein
VIATEPLAASLFHDDPSRPVSDAAVHLGLAKRPYSASPLCPDPSASSIVGIPLVLKEVAHSFLEGGSEKQTLAPLSRQFDAGRFHVVGGPSGAGKTTLLSILSTTVTPTRGMICWGEENLSAYSAEKKADWRRRHLGLIFQTSRLVGVMTVKEHLRLAASIRGKPEAEAQGLELLAVLGMASKLSQLPSQLSGGEKQRVAIAQALSARPAVLLADEPTAALDQSNAALVAHTLRTFARERNAVVICVSHDRVVLDAADETLLLEKA